MLTFHMVQLRVTRTVAKRIVVGVILSSSYWAPIGWGQAFDPTLQLVEEPGLSQERDLAASMGDAVRSSDAASREPEPASDSADL